MNREELKIGIIGAGGWGTALATVLSENVREVLIWAKEVSVCAEINSYNTNSVFLPGVLLPEKIRATNHCYELEDSDLFVLTIPTQFIRKFFSEHRFQLGDKPVINGAKGIERKTLLLVSEILLDCAGISPDRHVILTGPSHAEEVARRMPTTVVCASENIILAKEVQNIFSNKSFRVYTSEDVVGCEIGGALKNVIAIAAGAVDGLGLGDNTKAALITRGLAEISRLGISMGANPLTFSGLSGLGDLIVTCNSRHSRNRSVGEQIGKGKSMAEITANMQSVAEGVTTTESAYHLSQKHNVEMPIVEQMYFVINGQKKPPEALECLMNRQTKYEWWW
ncbi:MAG: Glycerol-3-phosphate dehydrogenase [Ignavibacteria bacterium]|nr:Glycerol-3-phosphate dehydrogenase [Ignavibacteria bacterium]